MSLAFRENSTLSNDGSHHSKNGVLLNPSQDRTWGGNNLTPQSVLVLRKTHLEEPFNGQ